MAVVASRSPAATRRVAARILRSLRRAGRRPIVLALTGELGSGKTAFVRGLARALGVRGKIQSPTFVIAKWHRLPRRLRPLRHFAHVDAYRLSHPAEAEHLGLHRIFKDRDAVVAIEWAERLRGLIPKSAVWIRFKHGKKSHERRLQISKS